jgi:chemotaxis response regulator CheB
MKKQATPERRKRQPAKTVLKDAPSPQADDSRRVDAAFPIVGIGASAGGLEALELFLQNVPEGSGMAFIIVQHLDPTHKGIMPELLQCATAMKVIQVKDRTWVQPDCVYVFRRTRTCPPCTESCTCSIRWRPTGCACRLVSSSAPWPRTRKSAVSRST